MARRPVILVGDTTSHGGRVEEGCSTDTFDGRALACVGHMVWCPKCKGSFAILPEGSGGHSLPWIEGLNLAVEGMRTACGATLIASQQGFVVEDAHVEPQVEQAAPPPRPRATVCLSCLNAAAVSSAALIVRELP